MVGVSHACSTFASVSGSFKLIRFKFLSALDEDEGDSKSVERRDHARVMSEGFRRSWRFALPGDASINAYRFALLLSPVVSVWDCIVRKMRYSFRPEWV
ncbi:hypothetical protein MRB53_019640 [Persea americana]|uniref:Uncharacterized protein n=1 Tax=Persea americana TaxID=3435 RepID=A0ACC2KZC0_PERAE|nr:hypothetical protein MRB53_019640 [Persea americana]